MESYLCTECHKDPIQIKKYGLCRKCYSRLYYADKLKPVLSRVSLPPSKENYASGATIEKMERDGEFEFVRSFFNKNTNWVHQPALFYFDGKKYRPDFYDVERNVFIEVSRTRQAYSKNKHKYDLFRKLYPKLNFEIRKPSGDLLNETSRDKNW